MPLWVQYGILRIVYRSLCKSEESKPKSILLAQWYTQPLVLDRVHPKLVRPWASSSFALIGRICSLYIMNYFYKLSIPYTFPHNNTFWCPWETVFLRNTVGKVKIARNEQFLLFPQCFLPVWIFFCHFRQIWNCRLQTLSIWKSLKFVVW